MNNTIIIPTSLGITALVLVAIVSFGIIDTSDNVLTTDTELEYYDTSDLFLPPDSPLFLNLDFDSHLDESKYDHLVEVIEKYDDILVFDVYEVHEWDESNINDMVEMMRDAGTPEDSIAESVEYTKTLAPKIVDYTKIYLSQDPIEGDVYSAEYTYELEGITITMFPKGDRTQEEKLERQRENQIIYEVSPRIIGELTSMKQVISDDGDVYNRPASFSYFDDEHLVVIDGLITTEQISALAMALDDYEK